ncbi:MAG: hypothetical protein QM831_38400 [Kofleriaceae bacterium]
MDFPAFAYGAIEMVMDAAQGPEAAAWATAWLTSGALPADRMRTITAGELVVTGMTLDPFTPHWCLEAIQPLAITAMAQLGTDAPAFEAAIRSTPWGALSACLRNRDPQLLEAALAHRDLLSTLRYTGKPKPLTGIVQFPSTGPTLTFDELVAELRDRPARADIPRRYRDN